MVLLKRTTILAITSYANDKVWLFIVVFVFDVRQLSRFLEEKH